MTEKIIQLRPSSYSEKLGNYIKELEEENKKLKEEYITLEKDYGTCELENSKLRDKIKELEKENNTLKELNVCVGCNNNPDYKSRIDKAIEYIHNNQPVFELSSKEQLQEWFEKEYYVELLKILRGE